MWVVPDGRVEEGFKQTVGKKQLHLLLKGMSRQQFEGCTASRQSRMRAERTTLWSRWLSNDLYTSTGFLPPQSRRAIRKRPARPNQSDGQWLMARLLTTFWLDALMSTFCAKLGILLVVTFALYWPKWHVIFHILPIIARLLMFTPPSSPPCSLPPVFWMSVCCVIR